VLCNEHINYTEYIKMYCKKYTLKLRTNNYFVLTSGKEKVVISFQSTFFSKELQSEIIFALSVLKIYSYRLWLMHQSTTRQHQNMSKNFMCAFDLNVPRRLANRKATSVL
jgi:hypothetical protein